MKKHIILTIVALSVLLYACDTPPAALVTAEVVQETNEVQITNAAGVVETTNVVRTDTNYTISAPARVTIGVASKFIPEPWGSIAGSVALAILGGWAGILNRKKNKALAVTKVLLDNINVARNVIHAINPQVEANYVAKIATSQTVAGVKADVEKLLAKP